MDEAWQERTRCIVALFGVNQIALKLPMAKVDVRVSAVMLEPTVLAEKPKCPSHSSRSVIS